MLPSHSIPTYGSDMAQTVPYHFHTFALVRAGIRHSSGSKLSSVVRKLKHCMYPRYTVLKLLRIIAMTEFLIWKNEYSEKCLIELQTLLQCKVNLMYALLALDYIEDCADRIPNEDKFCLPTCMTKTEIFKTYVEDMQSSGLKPVSLPTFCRLWKSQFRNVIIPKVIF